MKIKSAIIKDGTGDIRILPYKGDDFFHVQIYKAVSLDMSTSKQKIDTARVSWSSFQPITNKRAEQYGKAIVFAVEVAERWDLEVKSGNVERFKKWLKSRELKKIKSRSKNG